jgi:hypothetical protein
MDNVGVNGFRTRHLGLGFRSNSLHLERKIALTIPPEYRGKLENVIERKKKKRQRDESKELLTLDRRRMAVVE